MRRKRPPQVATIGSTIAAGLDIAICCEVRECRHSRTLDLEAPARELGREHHIADFVARSRCRKYQHRRPSLGLSRRQSLSPPCRRAKAMTPPMGRGLYCALGKRREFISIARSAPSYRDGLIRHDGDLPRGN